MATVTLGSKAEGAIIKLKENGALVDFYIAKQNYESGLNGSGRVLVVRKDCYNQHKWNGSGVNTYASSDIDSWLNSTYKNLLHSDIRTAMGTTKIYYTPGNGNTAKGTLSRSVFLLSVRENGQTANYVNAEGTALSSTVINLLRTAKLNGSSVSWWTRSPYTGDNTTAWPLNSNGAADLSAQCIATRGTRPAFTLPSSLYVFDDGSVSVTENTAPSTPSSISVPSSIQGGSTITISWGSSTDQENNLEGYVVERSVNGGSSWSQIYQGSGRSTTNTVASGTSSVMYRVRAYDSEGLYSGYKVSSQVSVINNSAPNTPESISIPAGVLGGGTLTVTWSAASDPDGNLTGYELERQVDGGAWAQVYKGEDTSYTDSITRGWNSVNYRVRSYDSYDATSGYTTGTIREVDNNRAPAITCDAESGTDLGTKGAGFSVAYSAGDEDGDNLAVTESIDGVELRTFTAEPGQSNTLSVDGDTFFKLLNGAHTVTISASDGQVEAVHKLIFNKSVTEATITLAEPMEADDKITICVLSVPGDIPEDAEYTVEVTNNALDETPVWEDCTMEIRNGGNHIFTNETAVNGFAFNFRVKAKRGVSGIGGYINSVQGGFQ